MSLGADSLALIPFLDLANHNTGSTNACSIRVSADGEDKGEEWQPEDLTGESAAVLTMEQEFRRNATWSDWKGKEFTLLLELR